ncbi:MAG: metallophosphoesterase [Candidatus Atribacteria bacterium]|nr:metallophosphoesterase [Candidatus Atribacteria bacterium]
MKLGILSDSHDAMGNVKKALAFFAEQEVNYIIHGGDYVAPFTVALLVNQDIPWAGVLGNNDGEILGIYQRSNGIIHSSYQEIEISGYTIWVSHLYLPADLAFQSGRYCCVIYGHTHEAMIKEKEGRFLINPGETCGLLTGKATVALCNLPQKKADIITL